MGSVDTPGRLPDNGNDENSSIGSASDRGAERARGPGCGDQGVSQTDFVLMTVLDEARRVVRERDVVELSLEQSRRVAAAMIDPPEPNEALREAFTEHRAKVAR